MILFKHVIKLLASLLAQWLKKKKKIHLSVQETWVQSPGQGRSPGEGNSSPFKYSCLGNPMDRRTW